MTQSQHPEAMRLVLPAQCTFPQLVGIIQQFAEPVRQMWPFFWLKAAAVRDADTWHLCVFSLSGRWSDGEPAQPLSDEFDALAVVSRLLDADSAWSMLTTLAQHKSIQITDTVHALAPDVSIPPFADWETPAGPASTGPLALDVAETPAWWYLNIGSAPQWLQAPEVRARIENAMRPDLERVSEYDFQSFISARFAPTAGPGTQISPLDTLNYHIDLPLALLPTTRSTDASLGIREIAVAARVPLDLEDLVVMTGTAWTSVAPTTRVTMQPANSTTWSYGSVNVPASASKLWFTMPAIYRHLPYHIAVATPHQEAERAIAHLYAAQADSESETGVNRWQDTLLNGSGPAFEIALANALSSLGVAVLFGGQLIVDGRGVGPETPGIDLIALDCDHQTAVAISAKGSTNFPKGNDINNTLQSVEHLSHALPNWTVFGIIACQAAPSLLSQFAARTDIRFWGREEIQEILLADRPEAITRLLWTPPWTGPQDWHWYDTLYRHG